MTTEEKYQEALDALKPFAERWRLFTSYTERGESPPPNTKNTAITPGALKRAAEVFYGLHETEGE